MPKDDSDRIEKWAATSLTTALALLLALTLCTAAIAQSTAFHANGVFADAFSFSENESTFVAAATDSTNGQQTTFMVYDHFVVVDPSTGAFQDSFGMGQIPNSAFHVQPTRTTASLNVDTSKVVNFDNQFCSFDPSTGVTCNSAPGGVVTGNWTVITKLETLMNSGTFSDTTPNLIFKINGTSVERAASANGNILGAAFAHAQFAHVGTNHNVTISVARH